MADLFGAVRPAGLALVAVAVGAGEELLFRGALQPLGESWWGPTPGWLAASVLFGLLHAATPAYFAVATAAGLYLGWLAQQFNDLVTPIVVHSGYDFAGLVLLQRDAGEGIADEQAPPPGA